MLSAALPTRRNFLHLGGAAAAGLALAPMLAGCTPADEYEAQAALARQPLAGGSDDLHELVRLATLAPSGHNTQPWKFRLAPGRIEIHPDLSRRVPAVDPDDRELWISLGSALENLLTAAHHHGYETEVAYAFNGPDQEDSGPAADHIAVVLRKTGTQPGPPAPLFAAIPLRQCTRNEYDRRPVPPPALRQLEATAMGSGINPLLFVGPQAIEPLLEYVNAGNDRQMADTDFKNELIDWLRFGNGEAVEKLDGLASRATGNPTVPRWLARLFIGRSLNAPALNKKDDLNIRSSSGLLLFTSAKNDKSGWVETGRAYQRFALLATLLGVQNAFLNQPCEVPELRAQVQAHLGLNGAFPQLLVRFGHGPAMPRSLRRPVSEVLLS